MCECVCGFDIRPIGCCIMIITEVGTLNHTLLPDMHLRVPVLRVKPCLTLSLFKMSGRYLINYKVL